MNKTLLPPAGLFSPHAFLRGSSALGLALLLTLAPLYAATDAPPSPQAAPPIVLFNGHDLSGWEGNLSVWRVQDGVIVGGSLEGNPRNEYLTTTRRFKNFVLRLEYKLVGTEGFINSGLQFRCVRIAQPAHEIIGYEADIGMGHTGTLVDKSRAQKFLARADAAQIKRLERPGEWNHYEIRARGGHIELYLNGERTVTYDENVPGSPTEGLIALQIHGKCKAQIFHRNLVLEELP